MTVQDGIRTLHVTFLAAAFSNAVSVLTSPDLVCFVPVRFDSEQLMRFVENGHMSSQSVPAHIVRRAKALASSRSLKRSQARSTLSAARVRPEPPLGSVRELVDDCLQDGSVPSGSARAAAYKSSGRTISHSGRFSIT